MTSPDVLPLLQGEGFDLFAAGPTFEASRRQFRAAYVDAARLAGELLSAYTFPRLFGAVLGPAMLEDVEQAARRWCPDFIMHEPAALAAPLVCRQLGLRNVAHGYGLRPPREYLEHAMNFFGPHWRARGLEAPVDGDLYRHLALDTAPRSLQPSREPEGARTFRYNAYRAVGKVPAALPADLRSALQGAVMWRPRIYVTFGTVFNRSPALIAAARAAAQVGGLVVVTIGADGDPGCLTDLGAHVHVHRFVEQAALLPYCDLVVSHGGAGTLLEAAAHGIPHLVLPQAADHFRNARAIVSAHAGRSIAPEHQTVALVASALASMLEGGALAVGARALAQEFAAMPDAVAAADRLEEWLVSESGAPGYG
ncbi:MAG: glycosyltransferase [Roseateles sp.]